VTHRQCHPLCHQSQTSRHRLHHQSPVSHRTCPLVMDLCHSLYAIRVKWSVIYAILCTQKSKLSKFGWVKEDVVATKSRTNDSNLPLASLLARLIIGEMFKSKKWWEVQKQYEGQWQWNMTKHSEPPRGVSIKRQSTLQLLLTLWREAATECGRGPSKSTIVDILVHFGCCWSCWKWNCEEFCEKCRKRKMKKGPSLRRT
jgi:hypothetical protein